MNRRMAKAKAARKWHAARRRWWERHPVVFSIRLDFDPVALAFALFGDAARDAAAALRGFGEAMERADAIDGQCERVHQGGVVSPRALPFMPEGGPEHVLPAGQLYMGARGGGKRYLGTTGPIRLRLGHDPLPGQVLGCTCTVERVTKTDSRGQLHQVDVPGPTCDWCQRQPPPPVLPDCGVCGEPIRPDRMTGTTCGCAPGSRGRSWSPMLCECTGTGPTCGYCRGHGVP